MRKILKFQESQINTFVTSALYHEWHVAPFPNNATYLPKSAPVSWANVSVVAGSGWISDTQNIEIEMES